MRTILFMVLALAAPLAAHDPGLSSSRVAVAVARVDVELAFHAADADALARGGASQLAVVRERARLTIAGRALAPRAAHVRLADNGDVLFELTFEREPEREPGLDAASVAWQLDAFELLPRGHRHYAAIVDAGNGALLGDALLAAGSTTVAAPLTVAAVHAKAHAVAFVALGVEHILLGYDHLLFLLALLAVARRLRSALAVVTAFTLAHSVTLGLATLDVVRLPGVLVESCIAASIVWVGVENLACRRPRARFWTTFAFGLVHGFGFASVLGDLGITASAGVAVPLVSFNLGVEIGQLAVAAAAWPCLVWLRRRIGERATARALSAVAIAAGAWWLVERTMLGA